jgi:hypothetical protein
MMITLYPDIVIAGFWAMIGCRAGRGHGPRGWRAAGKIPRAVTGLPVSGGGDARRPPHGQVHIVPPPMPPDIGQLTDIGDSGAKVDGWNAVSVTGP